MLYDSRCVPVTSLILAVDHEAHIISDRNKNSSINVSLILETALQMFPLDEFELLSELNEILIADSESNK